MSVRVNFGRRAVLRVPQVDPRQVHVDVAEQLAALRALGRDVLRPERGRLVHDLRARLVAVEAEHELDGRHAGDIDQPGHAVEARLVEQQVAVLGDDVPRAEDRARIGVAVDVRHAVGVALDARAHSAHAGRGARDGLGQQERRVVLGQQRGGLVVAAPVGARDELRVGDVAEERREPVVHLRLRLGGQHAGRRAPRHARLPLAVRDDVQGGGRRRSRRKNAEHDRGERERTSQD
jgi:hypothetical protein